jgi:hypothetical protein
MNDLPFPVFGLQNKDINAFLETYNKLKTRFSANFDDTYRLNLNDFELFNCCNDPELREAIKLGYGSNEFYMLFVSVFYNYSAGKYQHLFAKEYQSWAIAELNNDFGHVLISHETLEDKVRELLQPVELDFDDVKEFSRKFYVLAKDKAKAENSITPRFRELVLAIRAKDFFIEIKGNTLLAGVVNYSDREQTFYLAEFVNKAVS